MSVPKYDDMFNSVIEALHLLGGSASVDEIEEKVANILKLTDDDVNEIHRGSDTKLRYRLAWTRNYLKRFGLLENSARGVWSLTAKGATIKSVDKKIVNSTVKKMDLDQKGINKSSESDFNENIWQDQMIRLLKTITPHDFERLCQRVLRESGFIQVEVTGKSGDGGIDGRGVFKIGGFLSFRVIFQCKRYQNSVTSQQIREFKGTMSGRADKGLFITTGTFTRDAKAEALRDGSIPIDLVDGDQLVVKMKELGLGVKIKHEEVVEVDEEWFKAF